MNFRVSLALLTGLVGAFTPAFAAPITGGSLVAAQDSQNFTSYANNFLIQGSNFSISFNANSPFRVATFNVPLGGGGGTFAYTGSVNLTLPLGILNQCNCVPETYSVTYNGNTYSSAAGYGLVLNLSVASSGGAGTLVDAFNNVYNYAPQPFTLTGSFQVTDSGGTVLVSDTLTGSGTASGTGQRLPGFRAGSVSYSFAQVPEPASLGLTAAAAGLLLFARRRK